MKTRLVWLAGFLLWMTQMTKAQTGTIPIPTTLNEVMAYTKGTTSLQALEKGQAQIVTKAKGLGFSGAATNYEMTGEASAIRLKPDSLSFVVTMAEGAGDPSPWYILFKASVKKGKRSGNYVNTKTFIGKSGPGTDQLTYTVRPLGNQSYEIIPSAPLKAGQYFFINLGTLASHGGRAATAFAFGID